MFLGFGFEFFLGFKKSKMKGVKGICAGFGSLIRNVLIGIFGSVSKISSSLAKGLLALSNVKQFLIFFTDLG